MGLKVFQTPADCTCNSFNKVFRQWDPWISDFHIEEQAILQLSLHNFVQMSNVGLVHEGHENLLYDFKGFSLLLFFTFLLFCLQFFKYIYIYEIIKREEMQCFSNCKPQQVPSWLHREKQPLYSFHQRKASKLTVADFYHALVLHVLWSCFLFRFLYFLSSV